MKIKAWFSNICISRIFLIFCCIKVGLERFEHTFDIIIMKHKCLLMEVLTHSKLKMFPISGIRPALKFSIRPTSYVSGYTVSGRAPTPNIWPI